jgi:hypothetical protein
VLGKLLLFPVLTTLVLLEPVISFVCCFLMFGGVFAAIVFEVSAAGSRFPFFVILGMSFGFGAFLLAYQFLISLFISGLEDNRR